MNTYKRHRFPPNIISYSVWLYYRFNLSHRDIEDLLAEGGSPYPENRSVSGALNSVLYTLEDWNACSDTFFIDEVFLKINGKQHYLWRAVDQGARAGHAPIQISRSGTAVLGSSCCGSESIQSWQAPGQGWALSKSQGQCVRWVE